ncbi:MAG: hypothetical protein N0C81_13320 [Candidatus Thiodiazotropha lotti]|nr:hypothetical protein [Candidatus Thiodiazotropha lotti]ODC01290.1 hypothetical protein A3197_02070 [Candidatus Thiodiazotropha endoloripes]MCG7923123.1 hypothetical protein [Candidatus Thiodiazotropha lotti]MCG7932973.1 hypothetical protein [Candidatus Thiodiazotropha lotti]MCG7988881.1 hypothetical protein [Candidatus Thiodiazotropha lotti]
MKIRRLVAFTLLTLTAGTAMAHHDTPSVAHLLEHLMLVLAIGLPLFFGIKHLLKSKKSK